jgi:quercetin dioxygenase-like cupin family protein
MLTPVRTVARCSLVAALALSVGAVAEDALADKAQAQPRRTVLEHHDQSGVPGKEVIVGTVVLPPGASVGYHVHPGDEAGYIIKGSVIWKVRGQADKTLKAGDSFFNPRGSVHSIVSADSGDSTVISTWIVDKGKPMSTPVP